MRATLVMIVLAVLILPLASAHPLNASMQSPVQATATTVMVMHSGPHAGFQALGWVMPGTILPVIGRNRPASWLQIEVANDKQGWLPAGQLEISGDLEIVPITNGIATPSETPVDPPPTTSETSPDGGEAVSRTSDPPFTSAEGDPPANPDGPPPPTGVHLSYVGGRARSIFQRGQDLGNNRNRFSQVGDSDTANIFFLRSFDQGSYDLAEWDHLQSVIGHFAGSFSRQGLAAQAGMSAGSLLDPLWANPNICNEGESSLECEYRTYKPALALIMVRDTWDAGPGSPYHQSLRKIAQISIDHGVIPVFSTLAHQNAPLPPVGPMNESIRATAQEYNVPLWDLSQTTQRLPGLGVDDTFHLTIPPDGTATYFTTANLAYGMTRRNLEALQVLHTLLYAVMS